jgi:hypothetical protein
MLLDYQSDANVVKHDSTGLLSIGLQTQNSAIIRMALGHMDHQLFAQEGYGVGTRNDGRLHQTDDPAAMTQSLIELCV